PRVLGFGLRRQGHLRLRVRRRCVRCGLRLAGRLLTGTSGHERGHGRADHDKACAHRSHSEPDVNEAPVTTGYSRPGTNPTPGPDSSPALMEVRGGRRLSANSTTKDHRAHEATPTQACPPLGTGASPRVRGLTVL